MRHKFTITISDVKGSRHYTIDDILKRVVAIFLILIALLFAGGVIYITVLNHKVGQLDIKKDELQNELNDKIAYYEVIKSKIEEIESIIGIAHEEDENITHEARLSNITLTTVQQSLLLQFIPNGAVTTHNGISDKFGMRKHPIKMTNEFHSGLDFRTPLQTPIYAPALGIVEYAGYSDSGYGSLVIIDHGFGFKSYYAHLDRKMLVKVGQFVKKGDHIANSGNTGLSSGPHLHYEVRFLGRALNPINFVNWNLNDFSQIFEKETNVQWDSLLEVMSILLANKQNPQ